MSHDRVVLADLEMTHAEFILVVLQRALHRPAREGNMQDDFWRGARGGIAEEVFFLGRIENVAGIDEPVRAQNFAVALKPKRSAFDFPNARTFFGVLNVETLPRLTHHDTRIATQRLDVPVDGSGFAAGIAEPAAKIAANLADETLLKRFESVEKGGTTGVPFVGGEPSEVDAVGQGVPKLIEGDVVFGSVNDVVGDARFRAAFGIIPAFFGKEKIAVEHGAKTGVKGGVTEVNADNTVVDLAGVAAPLALDAGGFFAGLGMTGIVDDADGLGIGMITNDELLDAIANVAAVPGGPIEELLEGTARRAVEVGDGLNALTFQVGELPFDIAGEMAARLGASEAVIKLAEEVSQLRPQGKDLCWCHPELLTNVHERGSYSLTEIPAGMQVALSY